MIAWQSPQLVGLGSTSRTEDLRPARLPVLRSRCGHPAAIPQRMPMRGRLADDTTSDTSAWSLRRVVPTLATELTARGAARPSTRHPHRSEPQTEPYWNHEGPPRSEYPALCRAFASGRYRSEGCESWLTRAVSRYGLRTLAYASISAKTRSCLVRLRLTCGTPAWSARPLHGLARVQAGEMLVAEREQCLTSKQLDVLPDDAATASALNASYRAHGESAPLIAAPR